MKIAFATDDRKTIAQRTGRAKEFAVYELSTYKVLNINYIENSHIHNDNSGEHPHDHSGEHHGHSHKDIIDKLGDVDYIYLKHLGVHLKKDIEFTEEDEIMAVVKDFFHERTA